MSDFRSATDPASNVVVDCSTRGFAALAAGRLEDARLWAARCSEAPGGDIDPRCMSLLGRIAFEEGELDDAVALFRQARSSAPDDEAIARMFAEALAASGESREARAVIEEVSRRARDDTDILVDLSFLRLLDRDQAGAREAIERAAAISPGDQDVLLAQARLYEALGEPELAIASAHHVAAVTSSPGVLSDLIRMFLTAERYIEAEAAFRRLQSIDPEHAIFAQHGRIWCRIKAGDWRSALELAVGATHADRYELTTALLAYARDRLFTQVPEHEIVAREAALRERLMAAVREHAEQHGDDGGWQEGAEDESVLLKGGAYR